MIVEQLNKQEAGKDYRAEGILDFEICLYDTQPSAIGGLHREFIFAPRLDNLASSYCALQAIIASSTAESLREETNVRACLLFDNEEVGSVSYQGARSSLVGSMIARLTAHFPSSLEGVPTSDVLQRTYAKSFLISADMAHAVHPNYSDKHEKDHQPQIHKGPVLKYNCDLRYATSSVSAAFVRALARKHAVPLQDFVIRQDSLCGSTIGPLLSAKGVRVVDLGNPQLSMHSIRETCGVDDFTHAYRLFQAFYHEFSTLDRISALE